MAPNLQKLCGRLVRQGLFQAKDLEAIYREWRSASPNDRDSVESLAQFLVLHGHVSIDELQPCLNGLAQPQKGAAQPPHADDEFEVELVPVGRGLERRDVLMASIGVLLGAGTATLVAFLIRRGQK